MQDSSGHTSEQLLSVRNADTEHEEAHVTCPVITRPVRLQRCAFCQHGYGLLLDSSQGTLRLRCGAPASAAPGN